MNQITKHITGTVGLLVALAGCGQLAAQYRDLDCGSGAFSPTPPGMQGSYGMQGYGGQPMGPMASSCGDPNCGCGCGPGVPMRGPGIPMNLGALKGGMHHAVHGTGKLRPGKVRAGMFGWLPPKLTGQAMEGYHPLANAYPYPYGPQPANPYEGYPGVAPGGGYINEGGTCCGPHWYDFMVEGVGLVRNGGINVNLTSDGIADPPDQPDVVLSTDDADFNSFQGGYRASGRFQMNAVMAVEATYLGGLDWSSSAAVTSNNNGLFSVFSNFGNNPNGGFEDTDQATLHSVTRTSDLQSVDALVRRMWVSPSQKHSGSWTFGVRYYQINETLLHNTIVDAHVSTVPGDPIPVRPDGFLNYDLDVQNDLVGPELGIEGAHCLTPGITLLGEARGGIYGNRASQTTVANSTTIQNLFGQPVVEEASDTEVAYGGSARATLLWQFHPLAKLRGGYEVLYLDGVATGPANFNTQPFELPTRSVLLQQRDQVLYHGFNVGFELGW